MPLVFLMYYWCFLFACFYAFILYLLLSISTSYWVVFDPCKDLLNVNKDEDEDGVVNFMPWLLHDRESIPVPIEQEVDGPRLGEEKNLLLLLRVEHWIIHPMA